MVTKILNNRELTERLNALENAFINSRQREYDNTNRSESAIIKVDAVTPTVLKKEASIGDTEVTFNDVPAGNVTVYVEDENGNCPDYTMERNSDIITVYFEPSEYVTTITLSII